MEEQYWEQNSGDGVEWPDGAPGSSLANNCAALKELSVSCRFDVRSQRILVATGAKGRRPASPYTDEVRLKLRFQVRERFGFDPGKGLDDAVRHLAYQDKFDPVLDYLLALKWDGKPRLQGWLTDFLGVKSTALTKALGPMMLIAAVARAKNPGCRFDLVPCLIGGQGAGKSRALRILAVRNSWFGETELLHLGPRERVEMLLGSWIYELQEEGGLHRSSAERVKAVISTRTDRYRAAYARTTDDVPRRIVFWLTTNNPHFLLDHTGNRRFIPLHTGKIELGRLKKVVRQLWAEAVVLEANGASITLPKELWAEAASLQTRALEVDPWGDALATLRGTVRDGVELISNADVLRELRIPVAGQSPGALTRAAANMSLRGWKRLSKPFKLDGKTVRGFARPVTGERGAES